MIRWHTPHWKSVKRAVEHDEADLAVQGWLCVLIAVAAILAAVCGF